MITEKIKRLFFSIKTDVNDRMKKYGLTSAQTILLEFLNDNADKTIIQKELCDFLSLKHSTVISILKRLEMKGLITKHTNYRSEISITEEGRRLIESANIRKGFVEDRLLKGFTKDEIDDLSKYLDRLYSNINN